MTNTETLTLFPCRKAKVPYTFKKSSLLKAPCITQIGCHLQFKGGARRANLATLINGLRKVCQIFI